MSNLFLNRDDLCSNPQALKFESLNLPPSVRCSILIAKWRENYYAKLICHVYVRRMRIVKRNLFKHRRVQLNQVFSELHYKISELIIKIFNVAKKLISFSNTRTYNRKLTVA